MKLEILQFVHEAVEFLTKYKWIYDFKWVDVGNINLWNNSPPHWMSFFENLSFLELKNLLACDFTFYDVPTDIQDFFTFHKRCYNIILKMPHFPHYDYHCDFSFKGINPKKTHEIFNISKFLQKHVLDDGCVLKVVDIGSGLGHLPRIMSLTNGVSVLAVEGNADLHDRSKCNDNMGKIRFVITSDNLINLNYAIEDALPSTNFITGLHCCGTLSSNILSLYASVSAAEKLLLFSCCYHRMIGADSKGFPLSNLYKELNDCGTLSFVSPMFMRLGCQERKQTWLNWTMDDYFHHQYTVALRVAVGNFIDTNNVEGVERLKRIKIKRQNLSNISYFDFVERTLSNIGLDYRILKDEVHNRSWYSIFMALQMAIQEVVELFILVDRVMFLSQFPNIKTVDLIAVFDPHISPRNIAIYASK